MPSEHADAPEPTEALRGSNLLPGRIGLALGSGAARGWAHIGVIRALEAAGIRPDVVCGASVGAVVGAAYALGRLDEFEEWVRALERGAVMRNLDLSFRGGLLKSDAFFAFMSPELPDIGIGDLERAFAAVATDLETGQEVWLREGSLHDALRASVALPGLIPPAARDDRWLVDGGLVNPVPVSLCRALGADSVVAVDLNTTLLNRRTLPRPEAPAPEGAADPRDLPVHTESEAAEDARGLFEAVETWARELRDRVGSASPSRSTSLPSLFEVLANSLNIMQVRITRSRMAGDPPELLITPRLADFALLDLDRGQEAIEVGRRAAESALEAAALGVA